MSNSDNFDSVRYSALIDLWQHQNSMLWKWPAVVWGVTAALASGLIGDDGIVDTMQSSDNLLSVVFLFKFLFEIAVCASMIRARSILMSIRTEISIIEADLQVEIDHRFSEVAHPAIRNHFFQKMRVSGFTFMIVALSLLTLSSLSAAYYYFSWDMFLAFICS